MRSSPTANEGGTGTAATVADAAENDGGRFGLGSSGGATGTDGISPDESKRGNKARDATARFTKGDHSDLIPELLGCDVSRTGYGDWCDAGMACKASGIQFEVWDEWSSKDPRPGMYPGTEKLRRKWDGFTDEQLDGVGSGTLARIISMLGGTIPTYGGGARPRNQPTTNTHHASAPEDPCAQAIAALEAMFRPGDTINVVTECMPKANEPGKFGPVGYGTNVPYGDLRSALEAHVGGGVGGFGDALREATGHGYDPEAGAWWRVNPTDGHGVRDANVARLGNVLIEADGQPIEEQRRILGELRALGMPVICETDSGKKSVHAIVQVGAGTSKERYDERAGLLYEFCRVHGLGVDANCKNPSRLTRMPGAMRGKRMQSLLGTYAPGAWGAFRTAALAGRRSPNNSEVTEEGKFSHVTVAHRLIDEYHACFIDGAPAVWGTDHYVIGKEAVLRKMIELRPSIRERERREVYSYLALEAPKAKQPASTGLIAFSNGVLDIESMRLIKPSPEMHICNVIPHRWNPDAREQLVSETIMKIASTNLEVADNLLEVVGLCMTRDVSIGRLILLQGEGSNGKSTYFRMIENLLGEDNYSTVPIQTIGDRFQTVPLLGKLANIGDDMPADAVSKNACAVLKQIVFGNTVSAEYKGAESFHFRPYCTLLYSCNEVPRFLDASEGFKRRVHPIPLTAKFTRNDPDFDPRIEEKLATEAALETLARLAVSAYAKARKEGGMTENPLTREFRAEIELDNDSVMEYVAERYGGDGAALLGLEIESAYQDYRSWYVDGGGMPLGRKQFTKRVNTRFGFASAPTKKSGKQVRVFSRRD